METKTSKACWNCRDRKIGCDRTLPTCRNCERRRKTCLGYGLRLSWPRQQDVRRAVRGDLVQSVPIESSSLEFVNTTFWDISFTQHLAQYANTGLPGFSLNSLSYSIPKSLSVTSVTISQVDPTLANPDSSAVCRLVTSLGDKNHDLYGLLLRLSLSDETTPALAIRHAISALSYSHLQMRPNAAAHQVKALSYLSSTITRCLEMNEALQCLAASMLLNIYEAITYDGSSIGWAFYMCGSKRIANLIHQENATYEGDFALIFDWVFYHDVMYKFSIRHWVQRVEDHKKLAAQRKILSKESLSPMRRVIIPSIGCSLEMLSLLCQVIDLVLEWDDPAFGSVQHQQNIASLEQQIIKSQQYPPQGADTESTETHDAVKIAELYRLATLIYLRRVAVGPSNLDVSPLVNGAFDILHDIRTCERPFPLFIVGLEARDDTERMLVLTVITRTLETRPLGNLTAVRQMLEAAWVRMDWSMNQPAEKQQANNWKGLIDGVVSVWRVPPSFT